MMLSNAAPKLVSSSTSSSSSSSLSTTTTQESNMEDCTEKQSKPTTTTTTTIPSTSATMNTLANFILTNDCLNTLLLPQLASNDVVQKYMQNGETMSLVNYLWSRLSRGSDAEQHQLEQQRQQKKKKMMMMMNNNNNNDANDDPYYIDDVEDIDDGDDNADDDDDDDGIKKAKKYSDKQFKLGAAFELARYSVKRQMQYYRQIHTIKDETLACSLARQAHSLLTQAVTSGGNSGGSGSSDCSANDMITQAITLYSKAIRVMPHSNIDKHQFLTSNQAPPPPPPSSSMQTKILKTPGGRMLDTIPLLAQMYLSRSMAYLVQYCVQATTTSNLTTIYDSARYDLRIVIQLMMLLMKSPLNGSGMAPVTITSNISTMIQQYWNTTHAKLFTLINGNNGRNSRLELRQMTNALLAQSVSSVSSQQQQQQQPSSSSSSSSNNQSYQPPQQRCSFVPTLLNMWFDNRAKGERHQVGAQFACAKTAIKDIGTLILEERPLVTLCSRTDAHCAGCSVVLPSDATQACWPCRYCDEILYCSITCAQQYATIHSLTCGLANYFREQVTPLATVLLYLYLNSHCMAEYCAKQDRQDRPILNTDVISNENFDNVPSSSSSSSLSSSSLGSNRNLSSPSLYQAAALMGKLPQRSYQYRYYQLGNEKRNSKRNNPVLAPSGGGASTNSSTTTTTTSTNTNDLIQSEMLLAIRESADHKHQVLPQISSKLLLSNVLLDSLHVLFALEYITEHLDIIPQIKRLKFKGNFSGLDCSERNKHRIKRTKPNKYRLMAIIEDYKRLFRLNIGQSNHWPSPSPSSSQSLAPSPNTYFVLPVFGTFFWPDCMPNLEATYDGNSGKLFYRTIRPIERHDKLTIAFPVDLIRQNITTAATAAVSTAAVATTTKTNYCQCLSCCENLPKQIATHQQHNLF